MKTRQRIILALIFCTILVQPAVGQVMRSQVYQQFMRAEMLSRRGDDSAAIAQLDEVARLVPDFPPTYLREARLYDQLYQRNAKKNALNAAVFMYRKYLTLEFDEQNTREASARLRQLEDELKVAHFEDEENRDSQQELASEHAVQIVTDDASALALIADEPVVQSSPEEPIAEVANGTKPSLAALTLASQQEQRFSFIDYYQVDVPTTPTTAQTKPEPLTQSTLQGHWVTDKVRPNGRELWIFDVQPSGSEGCAITVSSQSGILSDEEESKTKTQRMWSMTKHYLREAKLIGKTTHEIINERIVVKPTSERLTFDVEVDEIYQGSQNLYKWGKNLVNNLSTALPFGTIVSNYVNSYVEKQESLDKAKNATLTYTFECSSTAPGVLQCNLSNLRRYVDHNSRNRSRAGDKQTLVLYRTDGVALEDNEMDLDQISDVDRWAPLFAKVSDDAQRDRKYKYPLALLYYYGIGIEQDERKAVELMNSLGINSSDSRAKTWLTNYFYAQAYGNEENSTGTRRKMAQSAQYWNQQLFNQHHKEWYGVKGDMLMQEQKRTLSTEKQDSALVCYRKGDEKGDLYASMRLGVMLMHADRSQWSEAEALLTKASKGGLADADLELAHLKLAQNDLNGYLSHLHTAADHGCPEAFEELADNYMNGSARGMELNPQKSRQMHRIARQAEQDEWMTTMIDFGYDLKALEIKKN